MKRRHDCIVVTRKNSSSSSAAASQVDSCCCLNEYTLACMHACITNESVLTDVSVSSYIVAIVAAEYPISSYIVFRVLHESG